MKLWTYVVILALLLGSGGVAIAQEASENEKIIKDLGHDDYEVRENAMQTLAEKCKDDPKLVKELQTLYKKTKDIEVKYRVAFILRKVGKLGEVLEKEAEDEMSTPSAPPPAPPTPPKDESWLPGLPDAPLPQMPDMKDLKDFLPLLDMDEFSMKEMLMDIGIPAEYAEFLAKLFEQQFDSPLPPKRIPGTPPKTETPPDPKKIFGIAYTPLTKKTKEELGLDDSLSGIVVTDVLPRSFAAKNGLQIGDIIIAINGEVVTNVKDLQIFREKPGNIVIIRLGKRKQLDMPLWKPEVKDEPKPKDEGDF